MTINDLKKDSLLGTINTLKSIAHRETDHITKKTLLDCINNLRCTYKFIEKLEKKEPIRKIGIVCK